MPRKSETTPAKKTAARSRGSIPVRTILVSIGLTIAALALVFFLVALKKVLLHVTLAALLAIAIDQPVCRLQKSGLKRAGAVLTMSAALFFGTIALSTAIAAPLAGQAVAFAKNAPTFIHQAEQGKGPLMAAARKLHLQSQIGKLAPTLSKKLSRLSSSLLKAGRKIASTAFTTTIVIILAIFMLLEGPKIVEQAFESIPERHRHSVQRVGESVKHAISRYTIGLIFMGALNGIVTGLALVLTGTPFAIPLAVWATIADLLPIVGGLVGLIPAALFAFIHSTTSGIIVVVAVLVYQQIKNHLLYPRIIGKAVELNSLVVLIAVLVGAELGHVAGAVIAIPLTATAHSIIKEIIRYNRGESLEPERGTG
ncbi:MAG: hypothetical protein NVSMB57_11790 [Actinomycetota bacterium]